MEQVEYGAVIRFLYLKGRTPTEVFDEMKVYGDDATRMLPRQKLDPAAMKSFLILLTLPTWNSLTSTFHLHSFHP